VRFEDVIARPRSELRRLFDFLDLDEPPGFLDAVPASFPQLDSSQLDVSRLPAALRDELADMVEALGYERSSVRGI
jgi:hypothetical protein